MSQGVNQQNSRNIPLLNNSTSTTSKVQIHHPVPITSSKTSSRETKPLTSLLKSQPIGPLSSQISSSNLNQNSNPEIELNNIDIFHPTPVPYCKIPDNEFESISEIQKNSSVQR